MPAAWPPTAGCTIGSRLCGTVGRTLALFAPHNGGTELQRSLIATALLAALAAGCGGSATTTTAASDGEPDLAAQVCALAAMADDPSAAASTFNLEVHDPLHDVADQLIEDEERAAAARLLEAKAAAEGLLADDTADPEELRESLVTLAERLPGSDGC